MTSKQMVSRHGKCLSSCPSTHLMFCDDLPQSLPKGKWPLSMPVEWNIALQLMRLGQERVELQPDGLGLLQGVFPHEAVVQIECFQDQASCLGEVFLVVWSHLMKDTSGQKWWGSHTKSQTLHAVISDDTRWVCQEEAMLISFRLLQTNLMEEATWNVTQWRTNEDKERDLIRTSHWVRLCWLTSPMCQRRHAA